MNTLEAIATRRSIRRFKDTPIPDDALQAILTAATQAPSAKNRQPWQFVYEQASLPPKSKVFRSFGFLSGLPRLLNSPIAACRDPMHPTSIRCDHWLMTSVRKTLWLRWDICTNSMAIGRAVGSVHAGYAPGRTDRFVLGDAWRA